MQLNRSPRRAARFGVGAAAATLALPLSTSTSAHATPTVVAQDVVTCGVIGACYANSQGAQRDVRYPDSWPGPTYARSSSAANNVSTRACAYLNANYGNLNVSLSGFQGKIYSARDLRSYKWNENNDCPD